MLPAINVAELPVDPLLFHLNLPQSEQLPRFRRKPFLLRFRQRNPFQFGRIEPDGLAGAAEIEFQRLPGQRQRHPPHRHVAGTAIGPRFRVSGPRSPPQQLDEGAVGAETPQSGDGQHPAAAVRTPENDHLLVELPRQLLFTVRTLHLGCSFESEQKAGPDRVE